MQSCTLEIKMNYFYPEFARYEINLLVSCQLSIFVKEFYINQCCAWSNKPLHSNAGKD